MTQKTVQGINSVNYGAKFYVANADTIGLSKKNPRTNTHKLFSIVYIRLPELNISLQGSCAKYKKQTCTELLVQ